MSEKRASIAEAPTVADVAAAPQQRVGKVDFSSTLLERPDGERAPGDRADNTVVPLTSVARPPRTQPDDVTDGDEDDRPRMPFILPPAKVDAAMAAEAEATRLAIAAARGELVEDDDEDEPLAESDLHDETHAIEDEGEVEALGETDDEVAVDDEVELETLPEAADESIDDVIDHAVEVVEVVEVEVVEEAPPSRGMEGLMIQSVADLDEVAAQQEAIREQEAIAREEAERAGGAPFVDHRSEPDLVDLDESLGADLADLPTDLPTALLLTDEPLGSDLPDPDAVEDLVEIEEDVTEPDADVEPDLEPADAPVELAKSTSAADDDLVHDHLSRSVSEIAADVVASMRRINEIHEQHVEALEIETARRCELLTAQAELDAELIRLHARREAHAIITAARQRDDASSTDPDPTDQLGEIGETFSRFAETIETTVATTTLGSPDHLRKS